MDTKFDDYFTVQEAASFVGVSPSTIRNWDRAGKLKTTRNPLNGYRLIRQVDLDSILRETNAQYETTNGLLFDMSESKDQASNRIKTANKNPRRLMINTEANQLIHGDCIEGMKSFADDSFDLAIADPPYNLSKGGNWNWSGDGSLKGFGGKWSKVMANWDDMPMVDYFRFTVLWLTELKRLVKPTGSIWVHGTYHNIGIINFALQLLEIEIINEVVWYKRNSFPNLAGRRLTASHETILWAHTGNEKSRKYHFDYEKSKSMSCPEDGLKKPDKQMRTVWDIPNNKQKDELKHGKHPTQKPIRLIERMLKLSAVDGGKVLVPFAGSGAECSASKSNGLNFVGFEIKPEYIPICETKLGISAVSLGDSQSFPPAQSVKESGPKFLVTSKAAGKKTTSNVPSLIKWTGSKRSQANSIQTFITPHRRYFEPFLGGGAMLFNNVSESSVGGDIYSPLIQLWKLVRDSPELIADDYAAKWDQLQKELKQYKKKKIKGRLSGFPVTYYETRKRFNQNQNPLDLNFLMRTCVNGIVRFNDKGEFNNSFHLSRPGMNPDRFRVNLQQWHAKLDGVDFREGDYRQTTADASAGDFVYLDPPYASNKQRYAKNIELSELFGYLCDLNSRGVRWALSFDGIRGESDLTHDVPKNLFERHVYLSSGNSAVNKVLNGPVEEVHESLYLSF